MNKLAFALVLLLLLNGCYKEKADFKQQTNDSLNQQEFIEELIQSNLDLRMEKEEMETTIEGLALELSHKEHTLTALRETISFLEERLAPPNTPSDRIKNEDVAFLDDGIAIRVEDAFSAIFLGTGSMKPLISDEALGIQVKPENSQIKSGDIVAFKSNFSDFVVIHRVIATGKDQDGWFAVTKGDNNLAPDPEKIRREDIIGILVGVLY